MNQDALREFQTDAQHVLTYRHTAWNDIAVRGISWEIAQVCFAEEQELEELLAQFERFALSHSVRFISIRTSPTEKTVRRTLTRRGFYVAEHIFRAQFNLQSISQRKRWQPFARSPLHPLQSDDELQQVERIAAENFFHGRFHEDPFADAADARARGKQWVRHGWQQGQTVLAESFGGEVVAFLLLEIAEGQTAEVYLGGSRAGSTFTPKLIASGLQYFADLHFRAFTFTISATNLPMVNIAGRIGGKITESFYGYHKFLGT